MSVTTSLSKITDAMQLQNEALQAYLDTRTGEVELVGDPAIVDDEHMAQIAEAVEEDAEGRFIALPDPFEIHEWDMMRRFAEQTEDAAAGNALLDAIHGRGAFRYFKDKVHELGMAAQWYAFRDEQYRQIAFDWCESNGVEYDNGRSD